MGSSSSTPLPDVTLKPLVTPVIAIDPRFCSSEFLTLKVDTCFFRGDVNYQDVHTESNRFVIKNRILSSRQTLVDGSTNAPIVNYKDKGFSFKPVKYVHAGSVSSRPKLFQVYAAYHRGMKTEVHVAFRDVVSGMPCTLGFEGHWRRRNGYFWITYGADGARKAVAKIHCPNGCSRSKYHLTISPSMDPALIVMVCEILRVDEATRTSAIITFSLGITVALI